MLLFFNQNVYLQSLKHILLNKLISDLPHCDREDFFFSCKNIYSFNAWKKIRMSHIYLIGLQGFFLVQTSFSSVFMNTQCFKKSVRLLLGSEFLFEVSATLPAEHSTLTWIILILTHKIFKFFLNYSRHTILIF